MKTNSNGNATICFLLCMRYKTDNRVIYTRLIFSLVLLVILNKKVIAVPVI